MPSRRLRALPLAVLALPLAAQGYAPRRDLEQGRYLKALAEAEAQLRQQSGNAPAWAAKSQALTALTRYKEALDAANRAIGLQPSLADGYLARALARGGMAVQDRSFSSLGNATDAIDDLKQATQTDPGLASAWISLGLGYQQLPGLLGGSTRKALRCADELRKVAPAKGDALQGMVLTLDGRWDEALPFFGRGLETSPNDLDVVCIYLQALDSKEAGRALGADAQREKLASEARRMLPNVKNSSRGLEQVCECLLDGGQPEEAWKLAQDSLPACDSPSVLRLFLGKAAAKAGIHRAEGLAALDQVVKEPLEGGTGGYATAWWRRGQVLKDLGRLDEARSSAKKALGIDPKHRGARELLDRLNG